MGPNTLMAPRNLVHDVVPPYATNVSPAKTEIQTEPTLKAEPDVPRYSSLHAEAAGQAMFPAPQTQSVQAPIQNFTEASYRTMSSEVKPAYHTKTNWAVVVLAVAVSAIVVVTAVMTLRISS